MSYRLETGEAENREEEVTMSKTHKSDGGPSEYYDFPSGAVTLNDLIEWLGDLRWKGDSFHLGNIMKAAWRWGSKEGTEKAYDARKILYTAARLIKKYAGANALRETLLKMLDDPQFKEDQDG